MRVFSNINFGVIDLVRMQNFSEKLIFLTPDTHMYAYKGVRYVKFFGNILMTPLLLFTFLQTINWTRTKISPFGTNFK